MDILELLQNYAEFLQGNVVLVVGVFVGIVVWLMSGCMASTIAELRHQNPLVHLFLGLVIPYLYPVAIFFVLPVKRGKREKAEAEAAQKAEGAPPPAQKLPLSSKAGEDELDLLEQESEMPAWNRPRLKEMATDIEGNPRGPFLFLMKDGHEQRAERIIDALEISVVIEIIDHKDESQRLRLPYAEIEDCTEL